MSPGGAFSVVGLIPAHAGSTLYHLPASGKQRAHPRSRGEHLSVCRARRCLLGSSPLTRGAHSTFTDTLVGYGLIPAHAGSTR